MDENSNQKDVIELVQDKDGVFKEVASCTEEIKVKEKSKPKQQKPKQMPQHLRNNPLYQFLDGAELSMNAINKTMKIFGSMKR